MLRGFFITGTDTGVGKTVVAAALMHRYRESAALRYWKPIQTGIEEDDDTATVRSLANCSDAEIFDQGVRLPRPVSPHLAARLSEQKIDLDPLTALIANQAKDLCWIVEGAGGALVPINDTDKMTDLMRDLQLPMIVVARSTLGTINHTLLTLEALRSRSLCVAGVVMVGDPHPENSAAIEQFGNVSVLGEMPSFPALNAQELGSWSRVHLDPQGKLAEFLHD
jgi:dethiobiotin synthase